MENEYRTQVDFKLKCLLLLFSSTSIDPMTSMIIVIYTTIHTYTVATMIMFILLIHKYNISRVMFIFSINSLMEIRDRSCYVFVFVLFPSTYQKYYVEGYYFSIYIYLHMNVLSIRSEKSKNLIKIFFLSVPCKRKEEER